MDDYTFEICPCCGKYKKPKLGQRIKRNASVLLDPMAGIGTTAICAASMGYKAITVELEDKFVGLQKQSKEYAERRLFKSLDWEIRQGDSRNLSGLLQGQGLKSVTSPPYGIEKTSGGLNTKPPRNRKDQGGRSPNSPSQSGAKDGYGETDGQIGSLKDTPLKTVTSPPYGETGVGDWKTGRAEFQAWVINEIKTKGYVEWQGKRYNEAEWRAMNHGRIDGRTTKGVHKHPTDGYSDNKENIGNLSDKPLKSITSPSYGDTEKRDRSKEASNEKEQGYPRGDHNISSGYEGSPDNIGHLPDKPLKSVMSPPYTGQGPRPGNIPFDKIGVGVEQGYPKGDDNQIGNLPDKPLKSVMSPPYDDMLNSSSQHGNTGIAKDNKKLADTGRYNANSEGQVGNEKGESYLEAMQRVYSEIALVSDVLTVVIKCPTRAGKLKRLDLDTISILESSGWRIHCQHRALLFEELEQGDMFEGTKKQVKGRLSFFRRLAWQKGQPCASWEDVIFATRKV